MQIQEIMTPDAVCVDEQASLSDAAILMRDLGIGAMPVCGADGRLRGIVTDRDIVVRCVAEGLDPKTVPAEFLASGDPVTVVADMSAEETLQIMAQHLIRRLPVIDGDELIGMITQGDIARALPPETVGRCIAEVSAGRIAGAVGA